jgi:hypothetical protein
MSLVADALQPFIVREFASLAGRAGITSLSDVIIAETAAYQLQVNNRDQSVSLDFRDSSFLIEAWAADCCRFSFASFQTISQVALEVADRDAVAWSLIKAYYAAFYAGHALIRMFGEACSFFDRKHARRLMEVATVFGQNPSFTLDSGLYRCCLTDNSTILTCAKTSGASGVHEAFWSVFGARMQGLSESVLSGMLVPADAQAVFGQLSAFIDIIRRRTGYSWLSGVRNDLQYRQRHGVWFPARMRQNERQSLSRIVMHWLYDPMNIDLDARRFGLLGEFMAACIFIVALCHTIICRIAERSTAGRRSFVCLGPMTYLSDIGARANGS